VAGDKRLTVSHTHYARAAGPSRGGRATQDESNVLGIYENVLDRKDVRITPSGSQARFQKQVKSKKVKLRPWSPIGLCDVEDPTLSTVNCEILATCSSTYSPVRTSQEAHSVSIK
jgi:hypothetical protein